MQEKNWKQSIFMYKTNNTKMGLIKEVRCIIPQIIVVNNFLCNKLGNNRPPGWKTLWSHFGKKSMHKDEILLSFFFLMIITVNLSKTVYDESHQKVGFSKTHSCTLTKLLVFSKMCKTTHQKHIWVVWDLLEAGEPLSYAIKKETNGLYIQYIYCSVLKYFLQMQ